MAADKPANAQMQFGLALSTLRETPASLQIIAFARHSIQTLPARLDTLPALPPPRPLSARPRLEHSVHTLRT